MEATMGFRVRVNFPGCSPHVRVPLCSVQVCLLREIMCWGVRASVLEFLS